MKRTIIIMILMVFLFIPTVVASDVNYFSDVQADHWGREYIVEGVKKGMINGYDDGTFRPEHKVTQAEAIKMLVSTLADQSLVIQDSETWYTPFYDYAVDENWYIPDSNENEPITRGQMALLVASIFDQQIKNENEAIQFLLDNRLSEGKISATVEGYDGSGTLTRAEAIKFVIVVRVYSTQKVASTEMTEEPEEIQEQIEPEEIGNAYSPYEVVQRLAEHAGLDVRNMVVQEKIYEHNYQIYDKNISYKNHSNEQTWLTIVVPVAADVHLLATSFRKMDESLWNLIVFIFETFGFTDEDELETAKSVLFSNVKSSLTMTNDDWKINIGNTVEKVTSSDISQLPNSVRENSQMTNEANTPVIFIFNMSIFKIEK